MQHRGRGFEPRHEYIAGLAQLAEHSANNAAVTGSSPVSCNAFLIDHSTLNIFAIKNTDIGLMSATRFRTLVEPDNYLSVLICVSL